jgi:hypothetical protein
MRVITPTEITLIKKIAGELGQDWFYCHLKSHEHYAVMRCRSMKHLYVSFAADRRHFHVSIGIDTQFYAYANRRSMQAAVHRPARHIANDIRGKLLPGMAELLQEAHEYVARMGARQERHCWLYNCLQNQVALTRDAGWVDNLYSFKHRNGASGSIKESCMNEYDLTINHLSLDQVIRLIGLLNQSPTGHPHE